MIRIGVVPLSLLHLDIIQEQRIISLTPQLRRMEVEMMIPTEVIHMMEQQYLPIRDQIDFD